MDVKPDGRGLVPARIRNPSPRSGESIRTVWYRRSGKGSPVKTQYLVPIVASLLLLALLIYLPWPSFAASTVVDLNAPTATATEQSRKVFKNPRGLNNYYVFYLDDADDFIRYAYSSDGIGWTSGNAAALIALEMITGDSSSWATTIYDDGAQLHVYLVYQDDTNARLRYRHGTIADASSTIAWATESGFGGYSQEAYGVSLAVASNARLFVAWSDERIAGSEAMRVFAWDVIPAGDAVSGVHNAITESSRLIVTANPSGTANEINVVHQEGTTILNAVSVTSNGVSVTFGTKSTLTGLTLTRAKISAATDTQATPQTHVAYRDGAAVEHRTYNAASGFGAPTTVVATAPDSVTLAMDETSTPDKVFVFYVKNGVAGNVFFKVSPVDTISFGGENAITDGTEDIDYLSAGMKDWGGDSKIPLAYTTQTTFLVRFHEAEEGTILYDASSQCTPGAGTTFTWSHTTSGTNRLLAVGMAIRSNASQTVSSADYANVPLTFIRADTNGQSVRSELWYLVTPASGTNTVRVNLTTSAKAACGAISLTGVHQSSPLEASNGATGSSTTPSVTVTTVADDAWVIDAVAFRSAGNGQPTGTPGAGQTERWSGYTEGGGTGPNIRGKGSTEGPQTPPGGVVMDWSLSASVDWAISAASFQPTAPPASCDALTVTTSDPAGQLWFNETIEPDGFPLTTQVNVSASFQSAANPALSVTNDGSATCDITLRLMSDPGTGRSLKFNTTNSAPWPSDASKEVPLDPSSVTVCTSVAPAGTCDIWLWADFENALSGQTLADVRVESV